MIVKINSIEGIGILGNGTPSDFVQFNLIYGKNGTGKSTLSSIFEALENKGVLTEGNCKVQIDSTTHQLPIVGEVSLPLVRVFNQSFIKNNLNWDSLSKSVLILSKEKINDVKELNNTRSDLAKVESKLNSLKEKLAVLNPKFGTSLSSAASDIKEKFKSFKNRSFPPMYNNYSIRELRKELEAFSTKHSPLLTLNPNDYDKYFSVLDTNIGNYTSAFRIKTLNPLLPSLTELVVQSKKINLAGKMDHLLRDKDLSDWIEEGLNLHKNDNSKCLFCDSDIDSDRLQTLKAHFDESLLAYQKSVDQLLKEMELYKAYDATILETSFLPQFQPIFKTLKDELKKSSQKINERIEDICDRLTSSKTAGDFTLHLEDQELDGHIASVNSKIESINALIEKHNEAIKNFLSETKTASEKIEFYLTWNWCASSQYFKSLSEQKALELEESILKPEVSNIKSKISVLERHLSKEISGATRINDLLEKFLPHKELKLTFDSEKSGYRLMRREVEVRGKLSEGEKTAIAFVYFAVKLDEIDDWNSKSILFIDDPISSLDSHNIHNIFSYISLKFGSVKQLFISTHNFHFFKLTRDWILNKNRKNKITKSKIYEMGTLFDNGRRVGILYDAHESLVEFKSEYKTLLQRIHTWSKSDNSCPSHGIAVDIANYGRKCLESFLSFKFGMGENFRENLVDNPTCQKYLSEIELLRVYSFVNTFSHKRDQFDLTDMLESQFVEGFEVAKCIVRLIEGIDIDHFNAHT